MRTRMRARDLFRAESSSAKITAPWTVRRKHQVRINFYWETSKKKNKIKNNYESDRPTASLLLSGFKIIFKWIFLLPVLSFLQNLVCFRVCWKSQNVVWIRARTRIVKAASSFCRTGSLGLPPAHDIRHLPATTSAHKSLGSPADTCQFCLLKMMEVR